jgi:hypothetical protein
MVPEQMVNEWLSEFQTGSDPCAASASHIRTPISTGFNAPLVQLARGPQASITNPLAGFQIMLRRTICPPHFG